MGGVQKEKDMLLQELGRRFREDTFPMSLFKKSKGSKAAAA